MFNIFLGPQPERFLKKSDKELRQRIWKKLDDSVENEKSGNLVSFFLKKKKFFN